MLIRVLTEGLGLGALLVLVCLIGIRNGAVGMVHLYGPEVQERCIRLGLTTREKIRRGSVRFKAVCIPGYILYVLVCVYAVNGTRGFAAGFWQLFGILFVMNLIDRFFVDDFWVGHSRHGGSEAVYYRGGQAQKMAVRNGGAGCRCGCAGRNHEHFD